MKKSLSLISVGLVLAACSSGGGGSDGDGNNVPAGNTARSLRVSDFNHSTTYLGEQEVRGEINSSGAFLPNSGSVDVVIEDDDETEIDDSCLENVLSRITVRDYGDGTYLIELANRDFSRCVDFDIPGVDFTIDAMYMSISVFLSIVDNFGNPVPGLSESTFADIDEIDLPNLFIAEERFKAYVYVETTGRAQGNSLTVSIESKNLVGHESNAEDPCEFDLVNNIMDLCVNRSSLIVEYSQQYPTERYLETFMANQIQEIENGSYFVNGTIDFSINNWDGTMTYHASDPEVVPSYSVSNGSVVLQGDFSPGLASITSKVADVVNQSVAVRKRLKSVAN